MDGYLWTMNIATYVYRKAVEYLDDESIDNEVEVCHLYRGVYYHYAGKKEKFYFFFFSISYLVALVLI